MLLENFLIAFGYFAFSLIIYSNGIVSITINSSSLLLLLTGYLIATQNLFNIYYIIILAIVFRSLGNFTIYEIIRKYGLSKKMKDFLFLKENVLKKLKKVFEKKGVWFIFVGKIIPSTHSIIVILCGISKTNRLQFNSIMILTNTIWILTFLLIGYYLGKDIIQGITYFVILGIVSTSFFLLLLKKIGLKKEDFI